MDKDTAQTELKLASDMRGVYLHRKGGTYTVFSITLDEKSCEKMVHYHSHSNDSRWTRTLAEFSEVVEGRPRFWKVREATLEELFVATQILPVRSR